jgi:hypothetical protein
MNKKLYIVLIVAVVFIIINAIAIIIVLKSDLTSEQVLIKSIQSMSLVKSSQSDIRIEIETTNNQEKEKVVVSLNLLSEINDKSSPKAKINFLLEDKDNISQIQELIKGEIISINSDLYFYIDPKTELPSFEDLSAAVLLPIEFKGIWFALIKEEFLDFIEELGYLSSNYEREKYENSIFSLNQYQIIEILEENFSKYNFLVIKKELPDKEISGQKMYHYVLTLDNNKFTDFILKITEEKIQELHKEEIGINNIEEIIEKNKVFLLEYLAQIGDIDFNVLIGKEDYLLYQFFIEKEIESFPGDNIKIKIKINNSEFNQPVIIEKPEEYISLIEIIKQLFLSFNSFGNNSVFQSTEENKTCKIDSDCVVFGKSGDCNCGCFNKNYLNWQPEGICDCEAPFSCECISNKCESAWW